MAVFNSKEKGDIMKTEDILRLDYRKQESKDIIRKVLCKIKPLSKYSDTDEVIPLETIEKVVNMLCVKYAIKIQQLTPSYIPNELPFYSVSSKRTDNHEWLGNVYGICLYETWGKLLIQLWVITRVEGFPLANLETRIK